MSWMQKLYETYKANANRPTAAGDQAPLLPVSHTIQQAHIEIALDNEGEFKRATIVDKCETIVQASELSSRRTTNNSPHGLADKIQYVAGDYEAHGGRKKAYFPSYLAQLEDWCNRVPHPSAQAVLIYVRKRAVVADLTKAGILCVGSNGRLLSSRPDASPVPGIFRVIPKHPKKKENGKPVQDQGDAFIRWRVEVPGKTLSATWEDGSLIESWVGFDTGREAKRGLCLITGECDKPIAKKHPKRLRHSGDGARLISSNDNDGYTFRGRFQLPEQAATVASDVTQKAHSALRWLIRRQSHRNGSQVVLAWAVSGESIPDPLANSDELFREPSADGDARLGEPSAGLSKATAVGDAGQAFASRLSKMIAGYGAKIGPTEGIVVMGLDSATKDSGRMAIVFYRDLTGSDFLQRLADWHEKHAWFQNFSKERKFVGAPAPSDIAEVAFGHGESGKNGKVGSILVDIKISRATVERLLPCIIDGRPIPRDLVETVVRRTARRIGMAFSISRVRGRERKEEWEWEKTLGIACSLFRGFHQEGRYGMALETERRTRDYLYGRLLAIAEYMEGRALYLADENRDTTAARLMQRFSDRPYSTWLNVEKGLQPYMSRLRAMSPAFLYTMGRCLDEVHDMFATTDYIDDRPLSGEYLLGYHCQRRVLQGGPQVAEDESIQEQTSTK